MGIFVGWSVSYAYSATRRTENIRRTGQGNLNRRWTLSWGTRAFPVLSGLRRWVIGEIPCFIYQLTKFCLTSCCTGHVFNLPKKMKYTNSTACISSLSWKYNPFSPEIITSSNCSVHVHTDANVWFRQNNLSICQYSIILRNVVEVNPSTCRFRDCETHREMNSMRKSVSSFPVRCKCVFSNCPQLLLILRVQLKLVAFSGGLFLCFRADSLGTEKDCI